MIPHVRRGWARKQSRDIVPAKAKICTVISGGIAVGSVAFSVYAGFSDSAIPDKDNPLWGVLILFILLSAAAFWAWGWGWIAVRKHSRKK